MKFNFYLKYFLAWFVLIILINYWTFYNPNTKIDNNLSTSTTTKVELWDIKNSIEVVWSAELVDEQSLTFNKEGTITKVNFKAWDSIKKWEIIAEIDDSDVYDSIDDAKINLENAKINLAQLYEWADESQILQSKNSITTAQNNLIIAQKEFENLKVTQQNTLDKSLENINTSKKELESSKNNLELSKKDFELLIKQKNNSLDNTYSNKGTTITNIEDNFKINLVEIEKTIEQIDYILWVSVENREKNDDFEDFLSAKNSIYLGQSKSSLSDSISMLNNLKILLNSYNYSWEKEKILVLLDEYLKIFNKLYETTDFTYKAVDNSLESVGSLSKSDIDSMKNSMSSYRSSSLSKISSINSSINTLNTLTDTDLLLESNNNDIASKQESIKSSELQIEKADLAINNSINDYNSTLESYKLALESKVNDIESKKISLDIANLNYKELLEWPTIQNITKLQNSIKQAEIKLETTYKNLDDYKLEAPFNWIVRKIDYMLWDNITNDEKKYVYIENPNLLEITVMLDQIDIVKASINKEAIITFDAYKNNPVKAKISLVDTAPVQSSWVISYEVKLILDDISFDEKILSWMTADVEIISESKTNALLLKTSAIIDKDWKKYVLLNNNWKEVETEIEVGISSWSMSEILSWIKEGDIVNFKDVIVDTSNVKKTTTTSLFPTWWWGGGWTRWF